MKALLIRHGKTASNELRRYCGSTDEPLSPAGREEAIRGGIISCDVTAYVSPLLRARETAALCLPNARIELANDLREMDFGIFEGRSANEMANFAPYRKWVDGNCEDTCPGGERMADFTSRVCKAFEAIVESELCSMHERFAAVAHGGTLMAIMSRFSGTGKSYFEWYAKNCGGYIVDIDEALWHEKRIFKRFSKFDKLGDVNL